MRLPNFISENTSSKYLKARVYPFAIQSMLMLGFLYQQLTGITEEGIPFAYSRAMIYVLILGLFLLLLKAPRWTVYLVMFLILVMHVYFYTQTISKLGHDEVSTRDSAVEMTSLVFLHGENPWNHVAELGVPATTGPASILCALPIVLLFGEINWLAFFFWILFYAVLLSSDIQKKNNSFSVLVLFFVINIFDFSHTLFWSLEELYFPYLFVMLAYYFINRRKFLISGIFLGITILFRLNYVFVILGFMLWFCLNKECTRKSLYRIGLGFMFGMVIVLTPFILVGGDEFWSNNPFTLSFSMSSVVVWPSNNIIFRALNYLGRVIGADAMKFVKLGLVAGVMVIISLRIRHLKHPFWHITVGAFLAHTIAWINIPLSKDYELFFILPAFIAIAFTSPKSIGVKKIP